MNIDKSLRTGSTGMLILKLLSIEDMYGYQIIEELERRSENVFSLKAGTLYPLLHTLEQKEIIVSYEKTSDIGRSRKYYHLTEIGKTFFEERKATWHTYMTSVNKVLGGYNHDPIT
ncbi:helix-turn-helix transcriptional regulator [Vallitalea pronyensis]|uniref:Helix-turn-helix transcriptional regulator n=1 Tax=Vallitalea pronyensis TaxID=1348613 RepID=A0A8J8SGY1_9FIRM|nr:PadR family transcriptional regulator [Vallitalea pronyensis]QUI22842.1 helix-turn-helix transcriptional regulator [Vallitalea pronyensis]